MGATTLHRGHRIHVVNALKWDNGKQSLGASHNQSDALTLLDSGSRSSVGACADRRARTNRLCFRNEPRAHLIDEDIDT